MVKGALSQRTRSSRAASRFCPSVLHKHSMGTPTQPHRFSSHALRLRNQLEAAADGWRGATAAFHATQRSGGRYRAARQYSFLITKKDPRIVPASLDFCRANLNRDSSSAGTSIPSDSLKPTARLPALSIEYITLIDRPLS
jgi:hypothetical protein